MKLKFKSDKCVACEKCTLVCSLVHNDITSLELGRIKITRNYPSLLFFARVFYRKLQIIFP